LSKSNELNKLSWCVRKQELCQGILGLKFNIISLLGIYRRFWVHIAAKISMREQEKFAIILTLYALHEGFMGVEGVGTNELRKVGPLRKDVGVPSEIESLSSAVMGGEADKGFHFRLGYTLFVG